MVHVRPTPRRRTESEAEEGRPIVVAGTSQAVTSYVSGWPLWKLSRGLIAWVTAVVLAASVAVAVGLDTTSIRSGPVLVWLVFLGLGLVSVEGSRRLRQPAGVSKDLLSVWALPVAFLLPPVYAMALPLPLMLFRQLRATRKIVYRRVFTTAAIALADGAVSWVFHHGLHSTDLGEVGGDRLDRSVIVLLALACAALGCAINLVLVAVSVRQASPATTWGELLLDREKLIIDAAEIGLGVIVTACWIVTPLLVVLALVPVLMVQRGLSHAQLRAAARLDAKTGLLNAKAWEEEAEREIVRARRQRHSLAVLIVDIDHFKRVNDARGHVAGDVALIAVVQALLGGLRPYDQMGRFGGEEFTVLLPGSGRGEACLIAERLRRAVGATCIALHDAVAGTVAVELTVSIGVAVLGAHGEDVTDLLTAADHALYEAKKAGRDQVAAAR
jgi:diguanylate cyclase (GGDEF)-like protein